MSEFLQSGLHHDAGSHPDADQLSAFAEHALPAHEQQQMLAHLATCPDCRTIVALSLPPLEESPTPQTIPARKPWFSGWNLAWLSIPALAAIVLFAVHIHNTTIHSDSSFAVAKVEPSQPPQPTLAPPSASEATQPADRKSSPASHAPNNATPHTSVVAGGILGGIGSAPSLPIQGRSVNGLEPVHQPLSASAGLQPSGSAAGKSTGLGHGEGGGIGSGNGLAVSTAPAPPIAGALADSVAAKPAAQSAPAVEVSNADSSLNLSPTSRVYELREMQPPPALDPLPSHLPALSIASSAPRILAIDTQHNLFLSIDNGKHWSAVPSPGPGHAVKVELVSATTHSPSASGFISSAVLRAAPAQSAPTQSAANASLTGTITDPSGAVIPAASVSVRNPATLLVRTAKTDPNGRYLVENLSPGTYQVEVQSPGFLRRNLTVTLAPSQQSQASLTLPVGQSTQTVTVDAAAAPSFEASPSPSLNKMKLVTPPAQPTPLFAITTDTGERWTSPDGQSWQHQ